MAGEIITATIGGIVSIVGAILTYQATKEKNKIELRKLDRSWQNKFKPIKVPKGERKNTILLIGKGRTGKTQLVSYFTDSQPSTKDVTNNFYVRTCTKKYKEKTITYYLSDYRGQNFGQLINNFIIEQLTPGTIMRYGDINTLLLMVDIVPSEGANSDPHKKYNNLSIRRIKSHTDDWNIFALDAVFALLEKESLQYICLLINKIDKLKNGLDSETKSRVLEKFTPLIESLKKRAEGSTAEFDIIFCSAYNGTNIGGVDGLESKLNEYSTPRVNSNK